MKEIVEKVGILCPYCPKETDSTTDAYLVQIYVSDKTNKSFKVNPEVCLNSWSNYHRKLIHPDQPSYPGGLKFKSKKLNSDTGLAELVEVTVNKSNCLEYYKKFEFSIKEWSRIDGLKR